MKKILIIAAVSLLLIACMKEVSNPDLLQEEYTTQSNQTANKMVERPMYVDFYATTDMSVSPVQCVPQQLGNLFVGGGSIMHGNASHVGSINPENSFGRIQQCQFGPAPFQLTTINVGQVAAANGDLMYFSSQEITNVIDGSFTGVVTITNGTGRFLNASGIVNIQGTVNFQTGIIAWTGTGSVTY